MADPAIMHALMALGGFGATTAGAWGFFVEPRMVKERHVRLESVRWPGHCRDLRIAVLGDFQVGAPWFKIKHLDKVVAKVNALEPDLIVLLGDYVIEGVLFGRFVHPPEIARRPGSRPERRCAGHGSGPASARSPAERGALSPFGAPQKSPRPPRW